MNFSGGYGNRVFPKVNCMLIMLKADDRYEAAVELLHPQVQATMPEIAEWVGYMVGWVWLWVERPIMAGAIQRLEVGD